MRLYIVRHGEALNQGGPERSLTPRGEAEIDTAGRLLAEESVGGVLYSPKLRTRQTAARILDAVGDVPAEPEPALLPPSSYRRIADLAEGSGLHRLVLVSHLPLVAELVGWFTSGDPGDYRLPGFPSGGIVTLDLDPVERGMGQLAWYAFPPEYQQRSR
jgi:phosphohistidine phosphatase SixA